MRMPPQDVLLELLDRAKLSAAAVEERAVRSSDAGYWRRLVPSLRLLDDTAVVDTAPPRDEDIAAIADAFRNDGLLRIDRVLPADAVARMNAAVDAVRREGWPGVFAFVYDEFWRPFRAASMRRLLDAIMAPPCAQTFHVWVHIVRPAPGESGWAPHVDTFDPEGRMGVWTALTDATLDNSCMYVVPRWAAPDRVVERFEAGSATFTEDELASALHGTRALPAAAGDMLGWGFDVIHWGSYARSNTSERRSFSVEIVAAGRTPEYGERRLLPLDRMPTFDERLRAVAQSMLIYERREPLMVRYHDLATRMI